MIAESDSYFSESDFIDSDQEIEQESEKPASTDQTPADAAPADLLPVERLRAVDASTARFQCKTPYETTHLHATVSKLLAKFRETGSVLDLPKCGRMKTVTNEETSVAVLASFSKSPQRSTRRMSLESGISRTSLRRILATHKWHPYKLQLLQHLDEDDPDRRTEFAEWAKQKLEQDPQFTQKILFSDEANFYVNGEVNKQNHHYWSDTNPHWIDPSKTVGTKKLMIKMASSLNILRDTIEENGTMLLIAGWFNHVKEVDEREKLVQDYLEWYFFTRNSQCIGRFKDVLSTLNLLEKLKQYPGVLVNCTCFSQSKINAEAIEDIFKINISEAGSSWRHEEGRTAAYWADYLLDIEAYENMRATIKKDIREAKRQLERNIADKAKEDPKRFFQYFSSKRTVKEEVKFIRNSKGN
ncbi:G2E3 ligase, partial [Polypterus senegalus]